MEPESSLPYSQTPANCPYPEPDQSCPWHPPHLLNTHLNIILPSTSRSPQWSLSIRFPHQNPVYGSPLPHTHYMPCPSHSSAYGHSKNTGWGVQIIKLHTMSLFRQHNNRNGVLSRSLHHYGPKHSWIHWTHILPTYIMKSRSQDILMCYN